MSDDTFMAPKQGRSTGSKIFLVCLILFGGMLLLCCGTGGWMYSQSGMDETAEAAEARTDEIAEIDVPDYFEGQAGVKFNLIFMKMNMAIYGIKPGLEIEVEDNEIDNIRQRKDTAKKEKKKPEVKKKKGVPKVKNKTEKKKKDTPKVKAKTEKKKKDAADDKADDKAEKPKMKIVTTESGDGALILMWFNMWGLSTEDEEQRKQMHQEMNKNSNFNAANLDAVSNEEIVIKGETVNVNFGRGRQGIFRRKVRTVEAVFSGKDNGMISLFMQVPESLYDHDEIVKMLENIK